MTTPSPVTDYIVTTVAVLMLFNVAVFLIVAAIRDWANREEETTGKDQP